ncbi:MAG: hypothetical protein NTV72_03575 [Candidatus Taylorbacteria bacterium]|nr:hypothetical protein [Candidatus Taylorbacteria bacterium]
MNKQKNSLHKGEVRFIVFKEDDTFYAVGLEFNLVIEGPTKEVVTFELFEALQGYVESAKKANLRPHILNQKTDVEYENLWNDLVAGRPIKSPFQVSMFGKKLV